MASWRFIVGDLAGNAISNVTAVAKDVSLTFRLNRPSSVAFRAPSGDDQVGGFHSDGFPKVATLRRTLRAYRREILPDLSTVWVCRFAGYIGQAQDAGDESSAWTTVTAYSPFQRLARRFPQASGAAYAGVDGAQIAKALVDYTNGLGATGIATSGYGNVFEASPVRSVVFDRTQNIGDAIVSLTDAYNGFDFVERPIDDGSATLVALDTHLRLGGNVPGAIFGYDMAPHNVKGITRQEDGEATANVLTGLGGTNLAGAPISSTVTAADSLGAFGRYEAVESATDITEQSFLDAAVTAEATFRAYPRQLVKVTPATTDVTPDGRPRGRVPQPWRDFNLGDTVQVWAGPNFRGGFTGYQRVYGFTIAVDENGVERLDAVVASPGDV